MNLWIKERLCPSAADREMGTGGVSDDFPQSESVIEVLARYDDAPYDAIEVVFVFNGDTFDFLKTSVDGKYTHHVDLNIARRKFARIAQAHSGFLNGLADRLQQPRRSVHFVVGNHDPELLFIGVQQDLALWLRAPGRVFVHPWAYTTGDVRIEHGSQGDSLFRMDPAQPFIKYDGRDVIAYPWGSVALLDVAMPMQPTLYHVDRLKPRDRVLALLPEVKELILSSYWRYWTGERLRSAWGAHDPMTQISWTLFKEVMYRWRSGDMNLSVRERYQGWMAGERAPKLWIVGHEHSPAVLTCVDRTLLVTGCWRNEYALSADGRTQTRLTNVYAEVFMTAGNVVRSELVEVAPAPLPDGYCPESVFDILPAVRELLASSSERQADVQAQKDQEAREKA
jgi:UDP-2,3-diacylglucosamine pyrophosphatase LpxH